MPQARRMSNPTTPANEVLAQVRDALDTASTFEEFQDALTIPDEALPDLDQLRTWTPEMVNDNWEAVSAALEGSRFDNAGGAASAPRLSNGQQLLSRNDNGPAGLSLASIKAMSAEDINRNWDAVQKVLGRAA